MIEYKDRKRRLLLALCRFYYYLQEYLIKVPRYTRKYYIDNIEHLDSNETDHFKREKQIWLTRTSFSKISYTSLIITVYFIQFCAKYLIFISYTLTHVDFKQPEMNILKSKDKNEHQFACIKTSCTKLSEDNELAQDLIQLPVFSICNPRWAQLYDPLIDLHQIGLMVMALLVVYMLVMGILAPLLGLSMHIPLRLVAFITCPNITRHLEAKCTQRLCQRLNESQQNYRRMVCTNGGRVHLFRSSDQCNQVNYLHCLPINSTSWWHEQLILFSPMISTSINLFSLVVSVTFHFGVRFYSLYRYENHYTDYANYINKTQSTCSIWDANNDTVQLSQISSNSDCVRGTGYAASMALTNVVLAFVLNAVYQSLNDVQLCLKELRFQLEMALEIGRQRLERPDWVQEDWQRQGSSLFAAIRRELIDTSSYSSGIITIKKLERRTGCKSGDDLEHKLACKQLASHLLDVFGPSDEVYADLLDKIMIVYWNLSKSLEELGPALSYLLAMAYLFNFGLSATSVYLTRRILNAGLLPVAFNMFGVLTLNIYISAASVVHSGAKRLEPLVWSIIALNLDNQRGRRLAHWNCLATKLLRTIDDNGGLAVKTFGVNITYVRILEVTFWTTTIILYAYTTH